MTELSKRQRKQARELMTLAYSRELSAALGRLQSHFQHWQTGDIDAFELDQRIHTYHQGPARAIWRRYSSDSDWELALPFALHHGILTVDDFPDDFWEALGKRIEEIKEKLIKHI